MNKTKLIILFLISMICNNSYSSYLNTPKKITIKVTNFQSLSEKSISCNEFSDAFIGDIKTVEVNNNKIINQVMFLIGESVGCLQDSFSLDTRAKIYIYYKNHIDTLCIGKFLFFSSNGKFKKIKNDDLINFLDSIYWHR